MFLKESMLAKTFPMLRFGLRRQKRKRLPGLKKNVLVIGADTNAYRGKKIYRKTDDRKTARKTLLELSGKTHTAVTGGAIVYPDGKVVKYCEKAKVRMKKLSKETAGRVKAGRGWHPWQERSGFFWH